MNCQLLRVLVSSNCNLATAIPLQLACHRSLIKQKNMETNNTLYYTDGHQVTITDSGIKVKKTLYHLNGITRHGLSVIYPPRIPFILLIALGSVLFIAGTMNFIPATWNSHVIIFGYSI